MSVCLYIPLQSDRDSMTLNWVTFVYPAVSDSDLNTLNQRLL